MKIAVEIPSVPYAHRLHGYAGRCSRIHGHNAKVTAVFEGEPDDRGFVVDFYTVRHSLSSALATLDHTLVIAESDPLAKTLSDAGEPFAAFPFSPTAENLAAYIMRVVSKDQSYSSPSHPVELVSVEWQEELGFSATVARHPRRG